MNTQLTPADIEKMRQIVLESDKKNSANEFDLNNPPRTNYVHQPYPKVVYHADAEGKALYRKVDDAEAHKDAMAAGWANEPVGSPEPPELRLDDASAAEAAAVDHQIADLKKAKAKKIGR
ncbi:MAG: hypothetical protein V4502_08060 [Pseudomonadota bacterium]